ncbi:hypothetical protein OH77DRAFT_1422994, partial [Trametes cingulata]
MYFRFLILAATTVGTSALVVSSLFINTPAVVKQCETTTLTWGGGVGPFSLVSIIKPAGGGVPVEGIEPIPADFHSFPWPTDFPAGSKIVFIITDSTGASAQSAAVTVQPGSKDCEL